MSDVVKTKRKRSLRKKSFASSSRRAPLDVDVSRHEVDAIFSDLASGERRDPGAALREVYALAIESVAKAFVDGLSSLCAGLLDTARSEEFLNDNPLAPWIRKYLPEGNVDVDALRETLSEKIQALKSKILSSMDQAMSRGGDGGHVVISSDEARQFENELLRHRMNFHPMTQERMARLIERSPSENGRGERSKAYKILHTPRAYRFSFGTGDSKIAEAKANEMICAPDTNGESVEDDGGLKGFVPTEGETAGGGVRSASEDTADVDVMEMEAETVAERRFRELVRANRMTMSVPDSIKSVQSLFDLGQKEGAEKFTQLSAATAGVAQALKEGEGWIARMGSNAEEELSGVLQDVAMQVADAVLEAYISENPERKASLSSLLRDDPRVCEDNSLSEFIAELESVDEGENSIDEGDDRSVTNDDLSRAFARLLADPDLDLN